MNEILVEDQDLSPGYPGDFLLIVKHVTDQFVTVATTYPSALSHEEMWIRSYKYVGPTVFNEETDMFHVTYQRHH
jgi:hypothetical protein